MIGHVAVPVPHELVGPCEGFYRILGWEPVPPPPGLVDLAAWLERGQEQIHLQFAEKGGDGRSHVALLVEDYDEVLARLRKAGFTPDPRREHWGAPRCFVDDPAGNRVELMSAPPPPHAP